MIAWNYERESDDEKRLEAFVQAVMDGATVVAGPETAKRLNERTPVLNVSPCKWIQEGTVFAIDCSMFGMFPPMELTPDQRRGT